MDILTHTHQKGKRWFASTMVMGVNTPMCHPYGEPILFRSIEHARRHAENMHGQALRRTYQKRVSAQKRRRKRSR